MNSKTSGILIMIVTAFLWSIAGLFIKMIDWNPFSIAFARSLTAALFIVVFIRGIKFKLSFPLIAAGVANALTMILFVTANKTTAAANAIVLQYIAPVITSVLSYFILKERAGVENIIAMVFITAGVVIMFFDKLGGGSLLGNILAVSSAFTFSLYFIFMRMQKDSSTIESVLLSHLLTVGVCFVISLFFPFPKITLKATLAILILGVFQLGISSVLFSVAIKRISAVSANLIAVIEPIFNPVWVFIVLKETPGANTIIGGTIIVLAVTALSIITVSRRNA